MNLQYVVVVKDSQIFGCTPLEIYSLVIILQQSYLFLNVLIIECDSLLYRLQPLSRSLVGQYDKERERSITAECQTMLLNSVMLKGLNKLQTILISKL